MPMHTKHESIWDHWTTHEDGAYKGPRAQCNHCGKDVARNVTFQAAHMKKCQPYINHVVKNGSSIYIPGIETPDKQSLPAPPQLNFKSPQAAAMASGLTKSGSGASPLHRTGAFNQATGTTAITPKGTPSQHIRSTGTSTSSNTPLLVNSHMKRSAPEDTPQSAAKRSTLQNAAPHPSIPRASPTKMANHPSQPMADGLLTLSRTSAARYAEVFYWASFRGNHQEFRKLIQEDPDSNSLLPDDDRELAIVEHLGDLPEKPFADTLVDYYFLAIQPVLPIVLVDEFNVQYSNLWQWYGDNNTEAPDVTLNKDSTFLCILWAVLYSGAVAAPSELWTRSAMTEEREQLIRKLEHGYISTVEWCKKKLPYPTEYTLAASLLHHSVGQKDLSAIDRLSFIAQSMREAQYLGVHQAIKNSEFSQDRYDWRRKLWFHVVSLDIQAAKAHGVIPMYGPIHPTFQDDMVSEFQHTTLSGLKTLSVPTSMVLALCRFEAARIVNFIVHNSSSKYARESDFEFVREQIRRLHLTIDRFVTGILANGVPEEGLLSHRIINAKPLVDQELYKENDGSNATVFGCWTRVMLTMTKHELDIEYHRAILIRNVPMDESVWHSLAEACTAYLRAYLHVKRTACYLPYKWFTNGQPPLQVMMCLLKYLDHKKQSKDKETQLGQMVRYLVEEVGGIMTEDFTESRKNNRRPSSNDSDEDEDEETDGHRRSDFVAGWSLLKELKDELDGKKDDPNGAGKAITKEAEPQEPEADNSSSDDNDDEDDDDPIEIVAPDGQTQSSASTIKAQ